MEPSCLSRLYSIHLVSLRFQFFIDIHQVSISEKWSLNSLRDYATKNRVVSETLLVVVLGTEVKTECGDNESYMK